MLVCRGVTNVAETLVIAQSFWLVLVEKKNCGYTALLTINRSTSLHFMPLPLAQSKHGDQQNQKLGSFPTNDARQHAPKEAQFFSWGGWGEVWMGFFCNLMFPNVYHMIPSCVPSSAQLFFIQVSNSSILYPMSILPKFLTIQVVHRKYYTMSILGVAEFAYNTDLGHVQAVYDLFQSFAKVGTGCLGLGRGPNKEVD